MTKYFPKLVNFRLTFCLLILLYSGCITLFYIDYKYNITPKTVIEIQLHEGAYKSDGRPIKSHYE